MMKIVLVISYWYEAKKLGFTHRYDQVPEEVFPVLLVACHLRGDTEMVVDMRSFERAWRLVLFLDHHISREIVEITHIATYNRITRIDAREVAADNLLSWDFDKLFSPDTMHIVAESEILADIENEDMEGSLSVAEEEKMEEYFSKKLDEPMPKAIKIPVYFYEKAITSLQLRLMTSMFCAAITSRSDETCTLRQVIEGMAEELSPEPEFEG